MFTESISSVARYCYLQCNTLCLPICFTENLSGENKFSGQDVGLQFLLIDVGGIVDEVINTCKYAESWSHKDLGIRSSSLTQNSFGGSHAFFFFFLAFIFSHRKWAGNFFLRPLCHFGLEHFWKLQSVEGGAGLG